MYSLSVDQKNTYNNQIVIKPVRNSVIPPAPSSERSLQPSFKAEPQVFTAPPMLTNIRTQLTTSEEQQKYSQIASVLSSRERKGLDALLRSGILLSTDSNDKTSTLDSLHKIISTPRAQGLDAKSILEDTINTIANPFIITQNFGDIPKQYTSQILQQAKPNPNDKDDLINEKTIGIKNSSACVSASIEFNLAKQMPAEFARFAQELTSPKLAVDKTIELKNLSDKTLDAVWLLNTFKVPYEMKDFNKAKLTLAPDKNAYIRAQIQTRHRDYMERSALDALMQSTFMNVGSQQSYDSLTDLRSATFSTDNKGLIEFEKTFTESIVENKNKTSVTYQILDENGKITGYEKDSETVIKQILESLAMGENVIVGYTYTIKKGDMPGYDKHSPDKNEEILSGHEITIIGAAKDKNGKLIFICNDTDDDNPNPVVYSAEYLVPKIHHAGLPQAVADKDMKYTETWVDGLNAYKEAKKQQSPTT